MKKTSTKIGPLRKFSKGYSGQKSNAYRTFSFNLAELNTVSQFKFILFKYFPSILFTQMC